LAYCLLNNALSYYFFATNRLKEGYFVYAIFTIVELGCFLFFTKQIIKNKIIAKYLPHVLVIFSCFNLIDYFFIRKDKSLDSTTIGAEVIIIIALCLYYFYEQLRDVNTLLIYSTHEFWIIIGFLIYLSGNFFLYIYAENTLQNEDFQLQYQIINSAFNLLRNILFSVAMFMKPRPPKFEADFPNEGLISDWNSIRSFKNVN
jgi:hypothetical protein